MNEQPSPPPLARLDPGRLWSGGAVAALIAGLVAVVGILFVRGVLDIPVLAPKGAGTWGNANTITYALGAALGTLVATGLLQLLAAATPRYSSFFTWIMLLLTTVSVLLPLTLVEAEQSSKAATAGINLVIGLTITILLPGVARSARQRPRRQFPPPDQWAEAPPAQPGGPQYGQVPPPREQPYQGAPPDDEWRQGTPR